MPQKKYPEVVVGAFIFNQEGKLLLVKSHKWKNKWIVPGGHIELGETIEDAVKREVKEETGLEVYDIEFLLIHESIFSEGFWEKKHFIFLDHACKTKSQKVTLNWEAQEWKWISLKETLKLPLEPFTKKTIEKYLSKFFKILRS